MPNKVITETSAFPYMMLNGTFAKISSDLNEDTTVMPLEAFDYNINDSISNVDKVIKLPFHNLMEFNSDFSTKTTHSLNIGYINYNYDNGLKQLPIDYIVNHDALDNIARLYNGTHENTYVNMYDNNVYVSRYKTTDGITNSVCDHILEHENIYYIIKYLRAMQSKILPVAHQAYTSDKSIYYQLYNDKVDGEYFAQYIYRAKPKYHDIRFGLTSNDNTILYKSNSEFAKIPVFRVETQEANLYFYIIIRNYKIPMKRIQTSKRVDINNNSIYTFIYICPEYILKNYVEFVDAISYIKSNIIDETASFSYDYLYDNHLWVHAKNEGENVNYGIRLANTNSTNSFRKVS